MSSAARISLLLTVLASACDRGDHSPSPGLHAHGAPGDGDDHGHEHAENAVGITRWTDKLELFAEHPPAVAGQEMKFLAHLTILDGFRPLREATVTLVLDGPEQRSAKVTKMLRPGIFQPVLTPQKPGNYRGRLIVDGPAVRDSIDGFEILVHPSAREPKAAEDEDQATGVEEIGFLKEQQWQVPFATEFARSRTIVPSVEVAGEVTTPPAGQAEVGAVISGRVVSPRQGLPRPGQAVRAGDLLATIAPAPAAPEAGAHAALAVVEAEARAQAARAAADRAQRLIADRAISRREVDEAQRELRVAEEAVRAARRAQGVFEGATSGRGGGIYRVTAPIDGVVVEVRATAGKSINAGDSLFRIVNLSEIWIRARVPEQEASKLRSDQNAAFKLPGLEAWLPLDVTGDDVSAAVVHMGRTVDPKSRTVDVIYALTEPDARLRVGALVRVAVPAGDAWEGVVVPRGALIQADGRSVVYVQTEGETFEERTVRLGPRSGDRLGIASGVAANERVVTRGANLIRLAARAPSGAGHGHIH